jgi:hypothetical protein
MHTIIRVLGCVSLAALLAMIPTAGSGRARLTVVDAPVRLAQQIPEGCWEPDDQPVDPMSPVMRAIMDCHEELGLSDAQMDRLDDLADVFFRETRGRQGSLLAAQFALMDILRPNPRDPAGPADVVAAEARIREIARLQLEQDMALLRVIEATKAVLSADQRGRLAALMRGADAARRHVPQQGL